MMKRGMAAWVRWTAVGTLVLAALVACSDKTGGPGGTGTSGGGEAGTATGGGGEAGAGASEGGGGSSSGGAAGAGTGGDVGSGTASSAGGAVGSGGSVVASGGVATTSGGAGGAGAQLQYVPVQQRSDGIWPDLDQIEPRELGADEAMCRISHYESEGGVFIESWTWQYSKSGDLVVRLTWDTGSFQRTVVFDEHGRYWTDCIAGPDCELFPEPSAVNWDQEFPYAATCPGSPPDGGFQQVAQGCSAPSSRDEACLDAEPSGLFQFTEAGQVRRVIWDTDLGSEEVECYMDGVLRATGYVADQTASRFTYYPDGRLLNASTDDIVDYAREWDFSCDENGWRKEFNLWEVYEYDYGSRESTRMEQYAFQGDPLRPEAVDFEFEYSDVDCRPPFSDSGTLSATLEWTGDSVEIHPVETSDPSLESATWEVALNPNNLSARLDADGNVVEVYPAPRSNLSEFGIRYLEQERLGFYTFEGEGACMHGTNPHLFLTRVLPYRPRSLVTACSTGEVITSGYVVCP